jgi:hypothetical protein
METVPTPLSERLMFYRTHMGPWSENAQQIGVQPAAVTALGTLLDAAEQARLEALAARDAARGAENRMRDAMAALSAQGSAVIAAIRLSSQIQGDDGVYQLARLPPPKAPSPLPAPGMPFKPQFRLRGDGTLELKWRCRVPGRRGGVIYEIRRRDGRGIEGPWIFLGTSGKRQFVDRTIAAGTPGVTYSITPVRSNKRGDEAQFLMQFGMWAAEGPALKRRAA